MSEGKAMTVPAGEVKLSDELAAADGYLFKIKSIKRTAKTVTFIVYSDMSPMRATRDGIEKTFRATSRLRVWRTEQ